MPQDRSESDEAMAAHYAALAQKWPGLLYRARHEGRPIGIKAVAAAVPYSRADLPALMRETETMAAALTTQQTK
jgi:hypothetical protein